MEVDAQMWESLPKFKEYSLDIQLSYYRPNLLIIVTAYVPKYDVDAVISHVFPGGSQKAVAHAFRSLTTAETNKSQIENESLTLP